MSRPEEMYTDSIEHPEKYDGRVRDLLQELTSARREPTAEERALLDTAVLDFAAKPRPAAPAPKKVQPLAKPVEFRTPDFATEVAAESPEEESAIPDGQPKAFWWV